MPTLRYRCAGSESNLVFFKIVALENQVLADLGRGTRLCWNLYRSAEREKQFSLSTCMPQNLEFSARILSTPMARPAKPISTACLRRDWEMIAGVWTKKLETGRQIAERADYQFNEHSCGTEWRFFLHQHIAAMKPRQILWFGRSQMVLENSAKPEACKSWVVTISTNWRITWPACHGTRDEDEEAKHFDMRYCVPNLAILKPGLISPVCAKRIQGLPALWKNRRTFRHQRGNAADTGVAAMSVGKMLPFPYWKSHRKKLRVIGQANREKQKNVVYTDFEDEPGEETPMTCLRSAPAWTWRSSGESRQFLKAHENHVSLQRLRRNQPLTLSDITELERHAIEAGGLAGAHHQAREQSHGLGSSFVAGGIGQGGGYAGIQRVHAARLPHEPKIEFITCRAVPH